MKSFRARAGYSYFGTKKLDLKTHELQVPKLQLYQSSMLWLSQGTGDFPLILANFYGVLGQGIV